MKIIRENKNKSTIQYSRKLSITLTEIKWKIEFEEPWINVDTVDELTTWDGNDVAGRIRGFYLEMRYINYVSLTYLLTYLRDCYVGPYFAPRSTVSRAVFAGTEVPCVRGVLSPNSVVSGYRNFSPRTSSTATLYWHSLDGDISPSWLRGMALSLHVLPVTTKRNNSVVAVFSREARTFRRKRGVSNFLFLQSTAFLAKYKRAKPK